MAMPAGQRLVWQIREPTQPIAWIAALARAIPSAPRAKALTQSAGVRRPPVTIRVTWPLS